MKIAHAIFSVLVFFSLVFLAVFGVWRGAPYVFYTLGGTFLVFIAPGRTRPQLYSQQIWIWLDQGWQTILAPILNVILQPYGSSMFGSCDETASSVVGKNRNKNLAFLWIDKVLSFFDPASGSHGLSSVEDDEGINWHRRKK
ncbi:MAG: hypothetical protein RPR28_07685 [Cycloclasticus sp.]